MCFIYFYLLSTNLAMCCLILELKKNIKWDLNQFSGLANSPKMIIISQRWYTCKTAFKTIFIEWWPNPSTHSEISNCNIHFCLRKHSHTNPPDRNVSQLVKISLQSFHIEHSTMGKLQLAPAMQNSSFLQISSPNFFGNKQKYHQHQQHNKDRSIHSNTRH